MEFKSLFARPIGSSVLDASSTRNTEDLPVGPILTALSIDNDGVSMVDLQHQTGVRLLDLSDTMHWLEDLGLVSIEVVDDQREKVSLTDDGKLAANLEHA